MRCRSSESSVWMSLAPLQHACLRSALRMDGPRSAAAGLRSALRMDVLRSAAAGLHSALRMSIHRFAAACLRSALRMSIPRFAAACLRSVLRMDVPRSAAACLRFTLRMDVPLSAALAVAREIACAAELAGAGTKELRRAAFIKIFSRPLAATEHLKLLLINKSLPIIWNLESGHLESGHEQSRRGVFWGSVARPQRQERRFRSPSICLWI